MRLPLAALAIVPSVALTLSFLPLHAPAQNQAAPHARVIALDSAGKTELPILTGPPETVTMRSGLIALTAGSSVGKHSTGLHEEILIVLEGRGRMSFADGTSLPVEAGHAVYCPPETEHNVTNTGSALLRYVYVVSSAPASGDADR
ncbi:MAG TPA: cupin domain-containing protein [Terracidiphilus sp.]|nr:cupin domain-containing protein [Terracidiphilus sp.]